MQTTTLFTTMRNTLLLRKHNLSDVQLSKWKRQLLENAASLFEPIDKQTNASQQRITQLEQLVGVDLGIGHFIEQVSNQKRPHSAFGIRLFNAY